LNNYSDADLLEVKKLVSIAHLHFDAQNPQAAPPIAAAPPTISIAPVGIDAPDALPSLTEVSFADSPAPLMSSVFAGVGVGVGVGVSAGVASTIVATAYLSDVHALNSDCEKIVGLPLGRV
jgi:hypothetical protein